jgi:hypothetical protein
VDDGESLFLKILDKLAAGSVLQDVVLVGSWVLPVYRAHFDGAPDIPVLRTTDVDFLVGMPPRIHKEFDVPAALAELGFMPQWSLQGEYCKYVHPDMEVEFLVPERGPGGGSSVSVDALRVKAQPLRFLSLAYDRSMLSHYKGYEVRVPAPEAFVLLKLLVLGRRKDRAKAAKDAYTAGTLGAFLLERDEWRWRLARQLAELPGRWQQKIRESARDCLPELLELS